MGADGAATLGTIFGQGTVMQPVRKLQRLADRLMIGVSGPVGVGQRISGTIAQLWESGQLSNIPSLQVVQRIRQSLGQILILEITYASEASKLIGAAAQQSALTQTLLAAPIEGQVRLYHFGCTGEPEEITDNIPFVTIGSGQNLADPFLAFLRTIFWKDSIPNMAEGIFAIFWSLRHAIRRNTGGVADPIQIMTLQKQGEDSFLVKELESTELEETEQAVKAAEEHLSQFKHGKGEPPPAAPAVASE